MADFAELLAYASGLYFIKPDLEFHTLLATLAAIHACDGILCLIIARHSGRNQAAWTLAGLLLGVWGALPLLLSRDGNGAGRNPPAPTRRQEPVRVVGS